MAHPDDRSGSVKNDRMTADRKADWAIGRELERKDEEIDRLRAENERLKKPNFHTVKDGVTDVDELWRYARHLEEKIERLRAGLELAKDTLSRAPGNYSFVLQAVADAIGHEQKAQEAKP